MVIMGGGGLAADVVLAYGVGGGLAADVVLAYGVGGVLLLRWQLQ
jgi:hypothetical protein